MYNYAVTSSANLSHYYTHACSCCAKHRSGQSKNGGDLTNAGTSLDMKPVPHKGLEEQAVGLESEDKEGDLDYERYKTISL